MMKILFNTTLVLLVSLALSWRSHADVSVPKPPVKKIEAAKPALIKPQPAPNAQLIIEASDTVKVARLQIPRKVLAKIQGLDVQGAKGAAIPAGHTMIAGLAMALALSFGGLWMARTKEPVRHVSLRNAGLALSAVLLAGTVGWSALADKGLPRQAKTYDRPLRINGVNLDGPLIVEVVEKGRAIKLIAPRAMLKKLADSASAKKR